MKKYKVLALSYAFPPMAYPRSIQVSRLLAQLCAEVTVLCGDSPDERMDPTIMPDAAHVFPGTIRVPYRRNLLNRILAAGGAWPDEYTGWSKKALRVFRGSCRKNHYKPDAVMTFGMPMSDHLWGLEYKKNTGIPWIAHFSDPWVDNPYLNGNRLSERLSRSLEYAVMASCDAAVFTSPETVDLVMRKYPAQWKKKAFCVPHCFDPARFAESPALDRERYIIRHIGSFYGGRSPEAFFIVLEDIARQQPELLEKVSIEFIGSLSRYRGSLGAYPHAAKVVKILATVSYAESLRLMQTANCLLVCDAPGDHSVFFPSKLADYLGAERFIMAISPKGAAQRIVHEAGGRVADPRDTERVKEMFTAVLREKPNFLTGSSRGGYEQSRVCAMMDRIIDAVCRGSFPGG